MVTYVGEENTRNSTSGMEPFCVTFFRVVSSEKTSFVASDGILVGFEAAVVLMTIRAQINKLVGQVSLVEFCTCSFPSKRQVGGGDDFDKVHEVVSCIIRGLLSVVQWVKMMAGPGLR
jgi:hypothetical protein